jgi:predicted nuclease with TOPRIM domain
VDMLKIQKEGLIKDKNELIQETNRLETDKAAYQNSIEAFNADIGKLKSQKQTLLKEIEGLKEKGGGTPPAGGEPEKGGSR